MASCVAPPTNTDIRRKSFCCSGSSRLWLQSSVARKARWRIGRSRGPPARSCRGSRTRSSSAASGSTRVRAAASSIESGSPSRRAQISATMRICASSISGPPATQRRGALQKQGDRRRLRQQFHGRCFSVEAVPGAAPEIRIRHTPQRRAAGNHNLQTIRGGQQLHHQRRWRAIGARKLSSSSRVGAVQARTCSWRANAMPRSPVCRMLSALAISDETSSASLMRSSGTK